SSVEAFVGLLGRRGGGGGASASRMSAQKRSVARRRLRCWLRSSWATTRSRPSASSRERSRRRASPRSASVSVGLPARSNTSSTRVDEVFTCCPPGPPLRVARNSSSEVGSGREAPMSSTGPLGCALHPGAVETPQRPDAARVRLLLVVARGLHDRRDLLERRMAQDHGELPADHALADLGVTIALRAELDGGVVHMQTGQPL